MTFSACSKDAAEGAGTTARVTMKITTGSDLVNEPETRTYYDELSSNVQWHAENEALKVLQIVDGALNPAIPVTTDTGYTLAGRAATFSVSLPVVAADEYVYTAVYPAVNYVAADNDDPSNFKIVLPARQTPAAASFDPNADLMIAKPVPFATQPTQMAFQFHRVAALAKMTLSGITAGEAIAAVEFSTRKTIAGGCYADMTLGVVNTYGYSGQAFDTIELDMLGAVATGADDIWFTVLPCELPEGDTFSVKVTTDKATYYKTVVIPADRDLNFISAGLSTFSVSDLTRAEKGKLLAPANLAAARGFSTLDISWEAVAGATGYAVSLNGGSPETVTDNAYTATGLAGDTAYDISVVALAATEAGNSEPATLQASTLYFKVISSTTSSVIVEWERAGLESQYTVNITDPETSASRTFTYNWSSTKGWGDANIEVPLRFTFHHISADFPAGKLVAGKQYELKVKAGTEADAAAWSQPIAGSVKAHNAAPGEIFYENFDNLPGSDPVMQATGTKSSVKVEMLSNIFSSQKAYGWYDGAGAMNLAGGSFGADVQLAMFKDDGWKIGTLGSGITHNAFNGCFRLSGDNANQSYIQTPAMSALTQASDVTVSFKTATHVFYQTGTPGAPGVTFKGNWRRDQFDAMELYVVHEDGTKEKVGATISVGDAGSEFAWKSHSIVIPGLLPTDKLMFTSVASSKSRYYIDEISVVKN